MSSSDDFDSNDFDEESEVSNNDTSNQQQIQALINSYPKERLEYMKKLKLQNFHSFAQKEYNYEKKINTMMLREQTVVSTQQTAESQTQTYKSIDAVEVQIQAPDNQDISCLDLLLLINNIPVASKQEVENMNKEQQEQNQQINQSFNYDSSQVVKQIQTQKCKITLYKQLNSKQNQKRQKNINVQFQIGKMNGQNKASSKQSLIVVDTKLQTLALDGTDFAVLNNMLYIVHNQQILAYDIASTPIKIKYLHYDINNCWQMQQVVTDGERLLCRDVNNNIFLFPGDLSKYETTQLPGIRKLFGIAGRFLLCYFDGLQFIEQMSDAMTKQLHINGGRCCTIQSVTQTGDLLIVQYENNLEELWKGTGSSVIVVPH